MSLTWWEPGSSRTVCVFSVLFFSGFVLFFSCFPSPKSVATFRPHWKCNRRSKRFEDGPFSGLVFRGHEFIFFRRWWKGAVVISLAFRERVLDVANTTPERTRAVLIDECTYTHDTFPLSPWRAMQLKDRKEDCDNVSESSGDSWNLQF